MASFGLWGGVSVEKEQPANFQKRYFLRGFRGFVKSWKTVKCEFFWVFQILEKLSLSIAASTDSFIHCIIFSVRINCAIFISIIVSPNLHRDYED